MLEELKKEYKELGEARTKFCHNVTNTFIKLYEKLNEKLAEPAKKPNDGKSK